MNTRLIFVVFQQGSNANPYFYPNLTLKARLLVVEAQLALVLSQLSNVTAWSTAAIAVQAEESLGGAAHADGARGGPEAGRHAVRGHSTRAVGAPVDAQPPFEDGRVRRARLRDDPTAARWLQAALSVGCHAAAACID